jgi:hypothetical protein
MSPQRSRISVFLVVAFAFAWIAGGGVAEAKRGPSSVEVCVDSATGVVSRVATSKGCGGGSQKWSASRSAPQLCWNATSLDPLSRTRLVSVAPVSGCATPLQSVPVGTVVMLCADQTSGLLRWPVTRKCDTGNIDTWVRVGVTRNSAPSSTTTTSTAPSTALTPSVSLQSTVIQGNTFPKAVTVTANVAGTIYFVEGSITVKSVASITNAHSMLWAQGAVTAANTPTAIAIDVDKLVNGYYSVFVVTSQGVISAPAANIVTISVPRSGQVTTTTSTTSTTSTTVAVRTQTLDQNESNFSNGCHAVSANSTKGQAFTAGASGPLSRVSAAIVKSSSPTQVTATIYAWSGTAVIGSALASKMVLVTAVPSYSGCTSTPTAFVDFDFAIPASVTAGSQYIMVLTTPDVSNFGPPPSGGQFLWNTSTASTAGGFNSPVTSPTSSGVRYLFKTYVDI